MDLPKPEYPKAKGGPRWSGRQIFSVLLPDDMNLKYNASVYFADRTPEENAELDMIVEIVNGNMITGPVDGNSISAFKGRILEEISRLKEAIHIIKNDMRNKTIITDYQFISVILSSYDNSPNQVWFINQILGQDLSLIHI